MARSGEAETAILSFDDTNTGSFAPWPNRVGNPTDFSYGQSIQAAMGCPVGHQSLTCFYNPAAFVLPPLAPGQTFAREFANGAMATSAGPAK